jgi:hypothetical protein
MSSYIRKQTLIEFQERIGYEFNDIKLLDQSLTHTNFFSYNPNLPKYKRLKWLGDAILKQVTSVYLFFTYPNCSEEDLHDKRVKLESSEKLNSIAVKLGIKENNLVLFESGVEKWRFDSYYEFVKSLIGAIYVDAGRNGHREVAKFINNFWAISMPKYCEDNPLVGNHQNGIKFDNDRWTIYPPYYYENFMSYMFKLIFHSWQSTVFFIFFCLLACLGIQPAFSLIFMLRSYLDDNKN